MKTEKVIEIIYDFYDDIRSSMLVEAVKRFEVNGQVDLNDLIVYIEDMGWQIPEFLEKEEINEQLL